MKTTDFKKSIKVFILLSAILIVLVISCNEDNTVTPTSQPTYDINEIAGVYTIKSQSWSDTSFSFVGNKITFTVVAKDTLSDGKWKFHVNSFGKLTASSQTLPSHITYRSGSADGQYSPNTISMSSTVKSGNSISIGFGIMTK